MESKRRLTKMTPTRSDNLFILAFVILAISVLSPRIVFAQQKLGYPPGRGSYIRYCGSCHGDDGRGNGPKAASLNPKPADLTQLAKKNGSNFPTGRVTRILDGSEVIPGHGTRQKPVWGHEFGAGEYTAGGNPGPQTVASERIQLILRYLESIQEK
jgi:mono/diheme cytochrome c family protein